MELERHLHIPEQNDQYGHSQKGSDGDGYLPIVVHHIIRKGVEYEESAHHGPRIVITDARAACSMSGIHSVFNEEVVQIHGLYERIKDVRDVGRLPHQRQPAVCYDGQCDSTYDERHK